MHHENQILSCTYKGTILSLHQEVIENNNEVTITASQSKEPNQQLICPTLHYHSCFSSFEKTVIDIIDTHVVILIKAYLSDILRKNLNVLIYAQMVKPCVYHDMRTSHICGPSIFYAFPTWDTVSSIILNKNVKDRMPGSKIVLTLMRYSFVLGTDQGTWQRQAWMPLKVSYEDVDKTEQIIDIFSNYLFKSL